MHSLSLKPSSSLNSLKFILLNFPSKKFIISFLFILNIPLFEVNHKFPKSSSKIEKITLSGNPSFIVIFLNFPPFR